MSYNNNLHKTAEHRKQYLLFDTSSFIIPPVILPAVTGHHLVLMEVFSLA